jgi:hypothetical protein
MREIVQCAGRATAQGKTRAAGGGEFLILTTEDTVSYCWEAFKCPFPVASVLKDPWSQGLVILSELARMVHPQERCSLVALLVEDSFLSQSATFDISADAERAIDNLREVSNGRTHMRAHTNTADSIWGLSSLLHSWN